ncbi:OLC1v1018500C1 [Oldenlandia corymbosa var. corymbosa]|uniref:OLC1v1018500C1 n=1 Tax=Oldenlandia corymbosa var. corymbosa TaxID=529605 RepID=A0AAV1EBQ6_OLDCO|nr:OLC1v1018500C1 [Oldenlandia corymbosa var. corymbosa]
MDADAAGELQDWEVLHSCSDSEVSDPNPNPNDFQTIDAHSEGMIQFDYFSVDPLGRRPVDVSLEVGSESEDSDNPSWVDPGLEETRFSPRKESWPDSGSDGSDVDRKFGGLEVNTEPSFDGKGKLHLGFEGIEEIRGGNDKSSENFHTIWSDSGGIELDSDKAANFEQDSLLGTKEIANFKALDQEMSQLDSENEGETIEEAEPSNLESKPEDKNEEEKKKSVVWWKVPLDFLRYCVFRANPVWTFSVAAAVMGFVILGRRLYKMKRKTRGLELKVTMDDKKISQFMSKAARLNEAFSVVKRVPVVRPSLPAVGVTPWPVMSLR